MNTKHIQKLTTTHSYLSNINNNNLQELRTISLSNNPLTISNTNIILITIPTPLTNNIPDLNIIKKTNQTITTILHPKILIILKSTTYPKTTKKIIQPILKNTNLISNNNFFLNYSPKRINPNSNQTITNTPKIISNINPKTTNLIKNFYTQLMNKIIQIPSPHKTKITKLIKNTFHQINITLINKITIITPHLKINI